VDHAARDSACHFRLRLLQRGSGIVLLARGDRRLDGLDESPDPADAGAVDRSAVGVAADALLGLRRVRNLSSL
jgi:hypothetical protein